MRHPPMYLRYFDGGRRGVEVVAAPGGPRTVVGEEGQGVHVSGVLGGTCIDKGILMYR